MLPGVRWFPGLGDPGSRRRSGSNGERMGRRLYEKTRQGLPRCRCATRFVWQQISLQRQQLWQRLQQKQQCHCRCAWSRCHRRPLLGPFQHQRSSVFLTILLGVSLIVLLTVERKKNKSKRKREVSSEKYPISLEKTFLQASDRFHR